MVQFIISYYLNQTKTCQFDFIVYEFDFIVYATMIWCLDSEFVSYLFLI